MKIAIMLRHLDTPGGIYMYTVNLLNALLDIDKENQYLLLYKDEKFLGTFADRGNVKEIVIKTKSKLFWDQIGVMRVCAREKVDIIFNPKLSVPLFTKVKTAFTLHGAEQFAVPKIFKWYDRIYFKLTMPLYYKKAALVFTQTASGKHDIGKFLKVDTDKVVVINGSYNEFCRIIDSKKELESAMKRYNLPKRFILFVGGITPLKNFKRLVMAFKIVKDKGYDGKLIVVGFKRWKYKDEISIIKKLSLTEDVVFVGYVPDEDMPYFYNIADALTFPSIYEGYGVPPIEALVSGCPVIASETGWLRDIKDTPVEIVDPYNVEDIANGIWRVLKNLPERKESTIKWSKTHEFPTWKKYAEQFLKALKDTLNSYRQVQQPHRSHLSG